MLAGAVAERVVLHHANPRHSKLPAVALEGFSTRTAVGVTGAIVDEVLAREGGYQDIAANYLTNKAVVRHFNQSAKVPFLFDAGSGQFISYEDVESFRYKLGFLKETRLGGAMYWEITADRKGDLLDLAARELVPAEP
jgi:GH18 family chitinase